MFAALRPSFGSRQPRRTRWWALFAGLAMGAVLNGCVAPESGTGRPAETRIALSGSGVIVEAPPGFCVDRKTLSDSDEAGFVLFGHCASITGNPYDPRPRVPALLSATIGSVGSVVGDAASLGRIAAFFETDLGRSTLARSGRTEDVDLLAHRVEGGLLLLQIRDRSAARSPATAQTYWRAITGVSGRMAALTVMPLAEGAVPAKEQIALLQRFARLLRAANATG